MGNEDQVKSLYEVTYDQFAALMGERPRKLLYDAADETAYSVFIGGNEFLFYNDQLFTIKACNLSTVTNIPGFVFPVWKRLEPLLVLLDEAQLDWEVHDKYSNERRMVIRLKEHWILYDFEFEGKRFTLRCIRLEAPSPANR